ncbi:MAG TPA: hypothetical protein VF021_12965, partial [Longimicrobiales bacterium]
WHWVIGAAAPVLLIVAFGKELLASFAWGGNVESVAHLYETAASGVLRAVSEVGLNIIESVGTLVFIHLPPRLGIDHVLAIARRFPEGMFGFSFNFPERIVRTSTEIFAGANDQDLPPGLAGQMWLDFRVFGPVIWGLAFGLQLSIVQYFFERTQRTMQSAAVFIVVAFILALPLTTGSFDFTFSVDILMLVLALWLSVKLERPAGLAAEAVPRLALT